MEETSLEGVKLLAIVGHALHNLTHEEGESLETESIKEASGIDSTKDRRCLH